MRSLTMPVEHRPVCAIRRPSLHARLGVAWLLIATFLLQPVLAYLSTPLVTHDTNGQQVVICTLEGEKLVELELPVPRDGDGSDHCPALQLYQIAGAAQLPASLPGPVALLYAVAQAQPARFSDPTPTYRTAYSSRAPPAVA